MQVLKGKPRDLGDGFAVARVLPQMDRRSIGPFVFFDYFGPTQFAPGKGMDVRPHPHIGLATITYLFEGTLDHRDSLGTYQRIAPGEVNWMTAGRGIVHSERTGVDIRAKAHRMHGIQSWIGLPEKDEETAPSFQHISADDLPSREFDGVSLRVIAGTAYGQTSPVTVFSEVFYVDAVFNADTTLNVTDAHPERAAFVVGGTIQIGDDRFGEGNMVILPDGDITLHAETGARLMLLGGAPLDGPRHMWWNFVSSSNDRIEQAKRDWRSQRIGAIKGDTEFIPLPER